MFLTEEHPLLAPLLVTPYELANWKKATVQFNYLSHISCLPLDPEMARAEDSYKKVMTKYTNPVLLILDEWLLLRLSESESKDIFELLHKRRKKSSTILCSQIHRKTFQCVKCMV